MSKVTLRVGVISGSLSGSEMFGKELLRCLDHRFEAELMTWTWTGQSAMSEEDLAELTKTDLGQLVFVDSQVKDLDFLLTGLSHRGRAVFLITPENSDLDWVRFLDNHQADDVLTHPFRRADVYGKLKLYHQIMAWQEVRTLNESFSEVVEHFHEDLQIAEQIQKRSLPVRFPDLKGIRAYSRYLAGKKAGGDFFDIADYPGGFSLLLSDSSSYGLSSAVLSILMKVASRLAADQTRSTAQMFMRIQEEIKSVLKFKDHLSLFYGNFSYQTWKLRYLSLGDARAFFAPHGGTFAELPTHGAAISSGSGLFRGEESEIQLTPGGRFILASDGFIRVGGGPDALQTLLNEKREMDAKDAVNELVYRVKSAYQTEDDVPEEDCTMIILDADSKQLKLVG